MKLDQLEARTDGVEQQMERSCLDMQNHSGKINHATGVSFSLVKENEEVDN